MDSSLRDLSNKTTLGLTMMPLYSNIFSPAEYRYETAALTEAAGQKHGFLPLKFIYRFNTGQ